MGGHYGTIHVRTEDQEEVRSAIAGLAGERTLRFLIAPPIKGWVTVFPEGHGQDQAVSEALANRLCDKSLIHCLVHDDDIFVYSYFEKGRLKDAYNSCPDYFGGKDVPPRGGRAEAFDGLLADRTKISRLQAVLDAERFDFELERQDQFASLLDLPNTATAYEYLQDGERDGVQQWKKFVHVPDLTAEKSAKRAAASADRAALKRLKAQGVLRADIVGEKLPGLLFVPEPVWCVDPVAGDVLLAWCVPAGNRADSKWPLFRVKTSNGEQVASGCDLADGLCNLTVSASGQWLAAGYGCGNWTIQLWDLAGGQLRLELPQPRMVRSTCFSPDERFLFSLSENTISVISLPGCSLVRSVELVSPTELLTTMPDGKSLVLAGNHGNVLEMDLQTFEVVNRGWIKGTGPALPEGLQERISPAALERVGRERIHALTFNPDGRYLACGTNAGLRVLDWTEVRHSTDFRPLTPRFSVEAEPVRTEVQGYVVEHRYIYAVNFDMSRQRVLFSGLEGKVRFLELANGRVGDLLVPPTPVPIPHLSMTADRSALVCSAHRMEFGSNKQRPAHLQIWNYPALCQATNLDW